MTDQEKESIMGGIEPISDGDMVFHKDESTVDRMARNAIPGNGRHGLTQDVNADHDDHPEGGWGFRIRKFLLR